MKFLFTLTTLAVAQNNLLPFMDQMTSALKQNNDMLSMAMAMQPNFRNSPFPDLCIDQYVFMANVINEACIAVEFEVEDVVVEDYTKVLGEVNQLWKTFCSGLNTDLQVEVRKSRLQFYIKGTARVPKANKLCTVTHRAFPQESTLYTCCTVRHRTFPKQSTLYTCCTVSPRACP